MNMNISRLRMTFKQETEVEVWGDCSTVDDCDALIAWLQLAKHNIRQWEKIRAKAARAAKASAGKNEDRQPRQVQDTAPTESGANRLRAVETS
jgi:hypothetical protein